MKRIPTLMYCGIEKNIMRCRLIGGTTSNNNSRFGIFSVLNVAQGRFPITLGIACMGDTSKHFVGTRKEPIRGLRPPFRMIVAISILPHELRTR
jgi:hypothetical protein